MTEPTAAHPRVVEMRLRRAAIGLFAVNGYAGTGIRHIARAAGMTSASMYHYTSSKEELLSGLMLEGQQLLNESAVRQLEGVERPEERLAMLVAGLTINNTVNPMSSRVIDAEVRSLEVGSKPRAKIVELRDAYEKLWADALALGVEKAVFEVEDQHLTRLGLLNLCTGLSFWYRAGGELNPSQLAMSFVDLAFGMVRAVRDGEPVRSSMVPTVELVSVARFPFEPEPDDGFGRPD